MSPKEKAIELVNNFKDFANDEYHECAEQHHLNDAIKRNSKQFTLIAADGMIYENNLHLNNFGHQRITYLKEVKKEIELL